MASVDSGRTQRRIGWTAALILPVAIIAGGIIGALSGNIRIGIAIGAAIGFCAAIALLAVLAVTAAMRV